MGALETIRESIANEGCISFARFMELALYHPEFGYYEHCQIGRGGDFYTSVGAGSLFGELLAVQFFKWANNSNGGRSPNRWTILESGAHDGRLAMDILSHWRRLKALDDDPLEYWILEPSARRQRLQQTNLSEYIRHVRWFDSWDALPAEGVMGVIFANELLDAFAVHRLGWDAVAHAWFEWGVGMEGAECRWMRCPQSGKQASALVLDFLRCSGLIEWSAPDVETERGLGSFFEMLPDGYILEVCPAASRWWQKASESLKSGFLMTFDYGFQVEDLLSPLRTQGTLRAYYQHRLSQNLLDQPGEQDLTASVNFTMLRTIAERAGLKMVFNGSQNLFLSQIVAQALRDGNGLIDWDAKRLRQFQTLSHPDHLGGAFKVALFEHAGDCSH